MTLDFYKNKNVFLTGHTGFKGTWLCRTLLLAGANVTGYSLQPPTNPSLFSLTKTDEKINSVINDIRNKNALAETMRNAKPDVVFHLAAQPLVRLSYSQPSDTYETNVMGTVNILEALRLTPSVKSFVNVTTDKVYENREWHWGYREDEHLCGRDPYSNSKSCSDIITHSYRESFFYEKTAPAVSTARSGNVIGGGDYAADRIIPDCIRALEAKTEIVLRNPHSTRPYQHVLECLSGYLVLAQKQFEDKSFEGAYNFGPDEESNVETQKLTKLFCDACGNEIKYRIQGDGGPHEANFLKLDCSKAKAVLGWKPRWDIKTAVEKTVEFAKENTDESRTLCVDRQIAQYFAKA